MVKDLGNDKISILPRLVILNLFQDLKRIIIKGKSFFRKAIPLLIGSDSPAFLPAVESFNFLNSPLTASIQSGLFNIGQCKEKNRHNEPNSVP